MKTKNKIDPRKDVFTTGEAAAICRVSQQTIIRLFDAGRLEGFKVPGSKFRRIPRANLIRLMAEEGIPMDKLALGNILICSTNPDLSALKSALPGSEIVTTGFDAGMIAASESPRVAILDYRNQCSWETTLDALRKRKWPNLLGFIFLEDEGTPPHQIPSESDSRVFKDPIDIRETAQAAFELAKASKL